MKIYNNQDREDMALDALIVAALRQDVFNESDLPDLKKRQKPLLPEDQAALDALGTNLVERIISGTWRSRTEKQEDCGVQSVPDEELAAAMNRGNEDGDLTDKAREEIERKISEAEEKEDEESQGDGT